MIVTIVLPQFFLPRGSVKLGRFVTSVEQPQQGYHDPSAGEPGVLVSPLDSYTGEQHTDCCSEFGSALLSLMSAGFSKRAKAKVRITTSRVKRYTLDNSDSWFEQATSLPTTRRWIERRIDQGDDVYMITGFYTVTDARISQDSIAGRSAGGQVTAPASLCLAAAGIIAPFGNLIDPRLSAHTQGLNGAQSDFVAPGEQVCALQYRKIRHRWLSSRDDQFRLSDVRQWPSMEQFRGVEEGVDDRIEVELEDVQGPDGDWEKKVVGDEVLFIRSFDEC